MAFCISSLFRPMKIDNVIIIKVVIICSSLRYKWPLLVLLQLINLLAKFIDILYTCLLIISVKKVLFLCLKQLVCSCLKLLMIIQTVAKRASWNKTVRFWVFGFWYLGNVTLDIGTQRIQIKVDELNRAHTSAH